jgi:hypothetical protein
LQSSQLGHERRGLARGWRRREIAVLKLQMRNLTRRRRIVLIGCVIVVFAVVITALLTNPALTGYVESPQFRAALEQETAKGSHFPNAKFAPIQRTGALQAHTENFQAREGWKAMTSLDANQISARFNPLGVFLRRWQIDDLHIDRAQIGVHAYEPKPEPSPAKRWYQIFLPDRVYLKRVWSDDVDVTWPMRGETGGIFKTHLVVTPHGRDFEYHAIGGTMKNPFTPELDVQRIHLLITKQLLALYDLDLKSGDGTIHGSGATAISGEKHADFSFKWSELPVREWLPKDWNDNVGGLANGDAHWTGSDYKLAAAPIAGKIDIEQGRLRNLKLLDEIARIANHPDLAVLELSECRSNFKWHEGECELKEIAIEQRGKFRIEGEIIFGKRSLGGTIQLGISSLYLDWLPNPEQIFKPHGGYFWTTVHLSGTLDNPKQDLSPRLLSALKESPGALIGAAFRALGIWLNGK